MKVRAGTSTPKKKLINLNRGRKKKIMRLQRKRNKSRSIVKAISVVNPENNINDIQASTHMVSKKRSRRRKAHRASKEGEFGNKENRNRNQRKKLRRIWRFTDLTKSSKNCQLFCADNSADENECVFIGQNNEVILIDDDDDNGDGIKIAKDENTEQDCKINLSLEEGEIVDSEVEISPAKVEDCNAKRNSSHLQSVIDCSFYKDSSATGNKINAPPLYEIIKCNDSMLSPARSSSRSEIIVLDSPSTPQKYNKKNNTQLDDSVIFVSEHINLENPRFNARSSALPNYIPLTDNALHLPTKRKVHGSIRDKVLQPLKKIKNHLGAIYSSTSTPKVKKSKELFTSNEKKIIKQYNSNTYNPNRDVETKKTGKRMVIVDGSNVAFGHSLNKEFSVRGLEICLAYFEKMGHEVKAVVPQFRVQKSKSSDPERLEKLHKEGKIVFTPCKNLPGKSATSYDDRFVLQLACEFDAAVVSNDNYRDLIQENSAFKKIIENRVIGYTWCNDMFILPKDPYGRLGPSLSVILNHT